MVWAFSSAAKSTFFPLSYLALISLICVAEPGTRKRPSSVKAEDQTVSKGRKHQQLLLKRLVVEWGVSLLSKYKTLIGEGSRANTNMRN